MYALTPVPMGVAALFGGLVALMMAGHVAPALLAGWVLMRFGVSALRLLDAWRFRRDARRQQRAAHWRMRYMLLLVPESLLWSTLGILFVPTAPPLVDLLLFATVPCVAAISAFTLVSYFPAALLALSLGVLPFGLHEAWIAPEDGWTMLAVLMLYSLALLHETWRSQQRWIETTRLRIEGQTLAQARQEAQRLAEAGSAAKSAFLANMSHEIRTPLTGMIGLTELLLQGRLSPQQRRYLELSHSSSQHLLRLVDEVLDYSKIQAGGLTLEQAPYSLHDLADELLALLAPRALAQGLRLQHRVAADVPPLLLGDAMRLRQVLANLLGNAIKFTARGQVQLSVQALAASPGQARLRISVIDTGAGIAPAQQRQIFEPFAQADDSVARRHGGTGLGLSISVALLQQMDSQLALDSEPGRGSRFWFDLQQPLAPPRGVAPPHDGAVVPALLALWHDDDDAQWYGAMLQAWGVATRSERRVAGLLAALQEPQQRAALVLVDAAQLAAAGAAELTALAQVLASYLRAELAGPAARSWALVMSAGEREPAWPSAAAALPPPLHLPYPLPPRALRRAVEPRPATVAAPALAVAAARPDLRGRRLLLCEDNDVNALIVSELLQRCGASVTRAATGREAMSQAAEQAFDLVLMDVQMPEVDGLQATRGLRQREQQRARPRVPIVALTANAMASDREACLQAGMDDYLTKPVHAGRLYEMVARHLAARAAPLPVPPTAAEPAPTADRPAAPDFDPSALAALPMVADGSAPQVADELLRVAEGVFVQLLAQAAPEQPAPQRERALHTLKSAAAQVGAMRLAEEAIRLEALVRGGDGVDAGVMRPLLRAHAAFLLALQAHRARVAQ